MTVMRFMRCSLVSFLKKVINWIATINGEAFF